MGLSKRVQALFGQNNAKRNYIKRR